MISVSRIAQTFMLQLEGGNEEKALRRLELPPRGMEQVRTMKFFQANDTVQVKSRKIIKLRLAKLQNFL